MEFWLWWYDKFCFQYEIKLKFQIKSKKKNLVLKEKHSNFLKKLKIWIPNLKTKDITMIKGIYLLNQFCQNCNIFFKINLYGSLKKRTKGLYLTVFLNYHLLLIWYMTYIKILKKFEMNQKIKIIFKNYLNTSCMFGWSELMEISKAYDLIEAPFQLMFSLRHNEKKKKKETFILMSYFTCFLR